MERIWAPWRLKYVRSKKTAGCIFCKSIKKRRDNLLVFKSKYSFAVLNLYPYNNGHILVSPRRHVKSIEQLTDAETLDLMYSIKRAKKILDKELKPQGYNIGINLSGAAGAGITGHLHLHIVPRWKGDTNFMPVLAGTKVISQSLDELSRRLKRHVDSERN